MNSFDYRIASRRLPTNPLSRLFAAGAWMLSVLAMMVAAQQAAYAADDYRSRFKPVPTQYIAVLADPDASSGDNAQTWGLWPLDPGPRGVRLDNYDDLLKAGGVAPAQWQFDSSQWWLEENGLIMEAPEFPLPPGEYLVTGGRKVLTALTIHPADENGNSRWELDHGASIYDVTHLGCRSAVYTPAAGENSCTPENAPRNAFRVAPGDPMPPVPGCHKQDYAVLIVVGMPIEN
jgi:hypothetical protein